MATTLRRCVSLGSSGVGNPGSNQDYANNSGFFRETATGWVRFWADWVVLQPESHLAPDKGSAAFRVQALDRQIAQANAEGKSVMVTVWRFPRWANGTASLTATQDAAYQLPDRIAQGGDPARRKALEFKIPSDLSTTSAFGRFLEFLIARYNSGNPSRPGTVAALEVCSEPNLQMWPQQGPSPTTNPYDEGTITIQQPVARMFQTAQLINARYGSRILLLGPGTADRTGDTRTGTSYTTATTKLLQRLAALGFRPGTQFGWSHHNYTDVEYDQGAASSLGRTTNRAAHVRRLLTNNWAGWPTGNAAAPGLALTEGGCRLEKIRSVYGLTDAGAILAKQAALLQTNWDRMYAGPDGAGVEMLSWYLFYTDPYFDAGLCDYNGTRRPVFSTWGRLPSLR
jgi:hypothetical protein